MATLTNIFSRFVGVRAQQDVAATMARHNNDPYRLRAIANEDIYFFVKEINNTRVVRESDPQASSTCWRMIAGAGAFAVALTCLLLPSVYGLLAGYQLQSLKLEQQRMNTELSALELQEAKLMSPARLAELAKEQGLVDPAPRTVVYLDGNKGSLALNVEKK